MFLDTTLPFGLWSAPKIFTAVADAAEWVLQQAGVEHVCHYLDDYLLIGPPGSQQCAQNLSTLLAVFDRLGIPVAPDKLEGPTSRLTFLGLELDTSAMVIRLPADKLLALQDRLRGWLGRHSCSKQELESLIGSLSHACTVVRAGNTFLRRMFELLSVAIGPTTMCVLQPHFGLICSGGWPLSSRSMGARCVGTCPCDISPFIFSRMFRVVSAAGQFGPLVGFS